MASLLLIVLVVIAAASIAGERSEGITAAELVGRGARGRDLHVVGKALLTRSEERRVGKECRSRWSPYH